MINRYRRAARSAQELELGELDPLDTAIDWNDDCHLNATQVVGQDRLELSANGLRAGGARKPRMRRNQTRIAGSADRHPRDGRGRTWTDVDMPAALQAGHWTTPPARRPRLDALGARR